MAKPNHQSDVIVIGAGFSGLAAAAVLERGGARVLVLEADAEVGGRIRSIRRGDGVAEAGGATIGGGYEAVIGAARRCGVELIDATPLLAFFREQDLVLGGECIRQADWPAHPANTLPEADRALMPWSYARVLCARHNPLPDPGAWRAAQARQWDIPFGAWLRDLGIGAAAAHLAHGLNPSYGEDADDVSALTLLARAAFSADQRRRTPSGIVGYTVARGVQRIPEAMAAALRGDLLLGAVAAAIAEDAGGIEVRCVDGARYRASRAICSVPFGALRSIAIDPPLAGAQARAVAELPAQPMTQLYFDCKTPFWEADGHAPSLFTDTVAGMVAAARRAEDPREITGLAAWAMGRHARRLDALRAEDAAALAISAIEAARPAARGQIAFAGRRSWSANPFARGGWAYFRPGQAAAFAERMGAPRGRLHLCGEHLAHRARGMEGAMESGERTAARVLDSL